MEATASQAVHHPQAQLPLDIGPLLTQRQLAILQELDENRFMHTAQFQRLYGVERVARDIQFLTDKGLIEQPKAQWVWRRVEGGGSRPRIHSLANPGAALLRRLKLSTRKRDWAELNRNLSEAWFILNVPHELAVVDAYVSFRLGVAKRSDHTLTTAKTKALSIPGRSVFPDKTLIVEREGAVPVVLPMEIGRSTEPNVRRAQPYLSFLADKFAAYHVYAYAELNLLDYDTPRFRVLTAVDRGEVKMRGVARIAFEICGGTAPDRFLASIIHRGE